MRFAGVILAGGRSSRMGGQDKAFIEIDGRTLISLAVSKLQINGFSEHAISTNASPAAFKEFGLDVLPDVFPDFCGPLAGVHAGLQWAQTKKCTHVMTFPVDVPFYDLGLFLYLARANALPWAIRVTRHNGERQPLFTLWPVTLVKPLGEWLEKGESRKVTRFIDLWTHVDVDVPAVAPPNYDRFLNINSPDDLPAARRQLEMSL